MKTSQYILTLLILLYTSFGIKAQTLPTNPDTKKVEYTATIETAGTKKTLFKNAEAWVNKELKASSAFEKVYRHKTGIQNYDPTGSKIIAMGSTYISSGKTGKSSKTIWFTITIDIKEDRYRYKITDFQVQDDAKSYASMLTDYNLSNDKQAGETQLNEHIKEIIASLKSVMKDDSKW